MKPDDITQLDDLVDLDMELQRRLSEIEKENIGELVEFVKRNFLENQFKTRCVVQGIKLFAPMRWKTVSMYAELAKQTLFDRELSIKEFVRHSHPFLLRHLVAKGLPMEAIRRYSSFDAKNPFWYTFMGLERDSILRAKQLKIERPIAKIPEVILKLNNDQIMEYYNTGYIPGSLQSAILFDDLNRLKEIEFDQNQEINAGTQYSGDAKIMMLPLSFAAKFGARKCFEFLFVRSQKFDKELCNYAIEGGNEWILDKCIELENEHKEIDFSKMLKVSIEMHRYRFFDKFFNWKRCTPSSLHFSSNCSNLYSAQIYLNNGSNVDEKDPNAVAALQFSCRPIHLACQKNALSVAKLLLDHGGDPDIGGTSNSSPLCWSAGWDDKYITQLLLYYGADPNKQSNNGRHPMHSCSSKGFIDIVKILYENGARIDPVDARGDTPLIQTAQTQYYNVAHFLLKHGANPNHMNHKKKTALHIAAKEYRYEICALLYAYGVDPTIKDEEQKTAKDISNESGIDDQQRSKNTKKVIEEYGESSYAEILIDLKIDSVLGIKLAPLSVK